MEDPKSKSLFFLRKFRQFGYSGMVVLGVTSLIIYDYTLTQKEKSAQTINLPTKN